MNRIVLAIALTAASPIARAAPTGNELLTWCRAAVGEGRFFESGQCSGYLQGVIAGWNGAAVIASADFEEYQRRAMSCIPAEATLGQVMRVVIQHLEASPQNLHKPAELLTYAALHKSFPCTK